MNIQDLSTCQPRFTGILPPTIASAATIAPITFMSIISGTVQIANITPPIDGPHLLSLIFTDAAPGEFLTSGNIAAAITPGQNNAVLISYNPINRKYYPTNSSSGSIISPFLPTRQITISFDNDEILTLPSNEPELVPDPGTGKINVLVFAFLKLIKTQIYSNIATDAYINIGINGSEGSSYILNDSGESITELTKFLGISPGTVYQLIRPNLFTTVAWGSITLQSEQPIGNSAITLITDNGGDDFEDGDPTNILDITICYATWDTTLKEFV